MILVTRQNAAQIAAPAGLDLAAAPASEYQDRFEPTPAGRAMAQITRLRDDRTSGRTLSGETWLDGEDWPTDAPFYDEREAAL